MTNVEWFVSQGNQKEGPLSTSEVVQRVVTGDLSEGALVWKPGWPDWQPLTVHFKRPAPYAPESGATTSMDTAPSARATDWTKRTNFFARYWAGEYSLPLSFWIVGFVGTLLAAFLFGIVTLLFQGMDFDPYLSFAYLGSIWLSAGMWGIFEAVGTWRSARRYKAEKVGVGKPYHWAVIAQVVVIGVALSLLAQLTKTGAPQLAESWQVAFQNDPKIPDYTLRLMRNGTELEIAGGFKYGLANDVERLVRASPQLRVVHLNSVGGRVGEAEKLARKFQTRSFITYTSARCLSACTVAFAAGRERYLKIGAVLGYHSGSFGGQELPKTMSEKLLNAGLPQAFVKRAVSYSSQEMWYPTLSELLAAKAISATVDSYRFAVSGYGLRPGAENFKEQLRKHSFFQAFESAEPERFTAVAKKFQTAYVDGTPEGTILDRLRESEMAPVVRSRLAVADDQMSSDYAALLADQYEWLGKTDAQACYEYAAKNATTRTRNALSTDLIARELVLTEKLLRARPMQKTASPAQLDAIYAALFQRLSKRYGEESIALLASSDSITPAQYGKYCQMAVVMFREISRLPLADAGYVMRANFKE